MEVFGGTMFRGQSYSRLVAIGAAIGVFSTVLSACLHREVSFEFKDTESQSLTTLAPSNEAPDGAEDGSDDDAVDGAGDDDDAADGADDGSTEGSPEESPSDPVDDPADDPPSPVPTHSDLSCVVQENGCSVVLGSGSGSIWEDGTHKAPGYYNGKTVCIRAGNYTNGIGLYNVVASAEQPVKITNCGGQVKVTNPSNVSFRIDMSRYLKVSGTGDLDHTYGIFVGPTGVGMQSSHMGISAGSSDVELEFIEISGLEPGGTIRGYAGISFHSYPTCSKYQRHQFTQYNSRIHDAYVHDVNGEGLYIGTSHHGWVSARNYNPGFTSYDCNGDGVYDRLWEADLEGVWIERVRTERTGRDGIQVGGAVTGALIADNKVIDWATLNIWGHTGGIMVNPGTKATVVRNWLETSNSWGAGLTHQGIGGSKYINNVVVGGGNQIQFLRDTEANLGMDSGPVEFIHNTLIGSETEALYLFCNNTTDGAVLLANNLFAGYATAKGANGNSFDCVNQVTSFFYPNVSTVDFVNPASGNYRLNLSSPASNAGTPYPDLSAQDFDLNLRSETAPDVGAFEAQP